MIVVTSWVQPVSLSVMMDTSFMKDPVQEPVKKMDFGMEHLHSVNVSLSIKMDLQGLVYCTCDICHRKSTKKRTCHQCKCVQQTRS